MVRVIVSLRVRVRVRVRVKVRVRDRDEGLYDRPSLRPSYLEPYHM